MPPRSGAGSFPELKRAIHFCQESENHIRAPEVRHVRSPWPLHSGGRGSRAGVTQGSAVGAEYLRAPARHRYRLSQHQMFLNPRATSKAMANRLMPHPRCFYCYRAIYTPQTHCVILRGYGHAAPKRGWVFP